MENIVTFCFALMIILQMFVAVSMNFCDGIDGRFCCEGYKWDLDKCIACENGFFGKDCGTKCLYPTFGKDCQSVCTCNATYCDHAKGCIQSHGVTGTSNVSEDSTTPECGAKKTLNERIHYLLYPIFGLTAVSVIIYMMYLYTRSLEKRPVKTNRV